MLLVSDSLVDDARSAYDVIHDQAGEFNPRSGASDLSAIDRWTLRNEGDGWLLQGGVVSVVEQLPYHAGLRVVIIFEDGDRLCGMLLDGGQSLGPIGVVTSSRLSLMRFRSATFLKSVAKEAPTASAVTRHLAVITSGSFNCILESDTSEGVLRALSSLSLEEGAVVTMTTDRDVAERRLRGGA